MEIVSTHKFTEVSIPPIRPVSGWKNIEIRECGEELIRLNDLSPESITVNPQYYLRDIPHSSPELFARFSVSQKLKEAAGYLPERHKLVIWDAWRPLEVQQALFDTHLESLRQQNPSFSENKLIELAQTYVSLPSKDPHKPSPHYTGGAIDLSLIAADGKPLDMGTPFDHFGPESATRYYEDKPLSRVDETRRNNRRILYHAMTIVGLSGYDEEWWHFDFGNQFDAARTNKPYAIYAPPPK